MLSLINCLRQQKGQVPNSDVWLTTKDFYSLSHYCRKELKILSLGHVFDLIPRMRTYSLLIVFTSNIIEPYVLRVQKYYHSIYYFSLLILLYLFFELVIEQLLNLFCHFRCVGFSRFLNHHQFTTQVQYLNVLCFGVFMFITSRQRCLFDSTKSVPKMCLI